MIHRNQLREDTSYILFNISQRFCLSFSFFFAGWPQSLAFPIDTQRGEKIRWEYSVTRDCPGKWPRFMALNNVDDEITRRYSRRVIVVADRNGGGRACRS